MAIRAGVGFFVILLAAVCARAGDLPAAGSVDLGGESHGWVAVPVNTLGGGAAILHLPPRTGGLRGDASDGTARLALRIPELPERLAAWDRDVFMVSSATDAGQGRKQRRVVRMSVEPGPIQGTWINDTEGRLPALASLPGEGSLDGFVATERGPVALLRGRADTTERRRYTLLLYAGATWRPLAPPERWWGEDGPGASSRLELVSLPPRAWRDPADGKVKLVVEVGLVRVGGDRPGMWTCVVPRIRARGTQAQEEWRNEWMFSPLSFTARDGSPAMRPTSGLSFVGTGLAYAARTPKGAVELWKVSAGPARRVRSVNGVAPDFGVVPLDQAGRLALMWQEHVSEPAAGRSDTGTAAPEARTRIVEVSVANGKSVYDGLARIGPPVSPEELKLLAVALVCLMALVLIFVLRPEPQGPPLSLPPGFALAEPARRIMATAIDVAVAAVAASQLTRVPILELLTPAAFLSDPAGVEAVLTLIGIGFLHTTTSEWLTGRSIGKTLTGCEVVHVVTRKADDGEIEIVMERPSLWRAAVRNVVRWAIPPLALSGLAGADHRHRGDVSAGTVVVVRLPERDAQ